MTEWFSVSTSAAQERLVAAWDSAPVENEELCSFLADVSRTQVVAYAAEDDAPALQVAELLDGLGITSTVINEVLELLEFEEDPEPPARYVFAQLQQMKNLYNAAEASPMGEMGPDSYSFVPRPLDKTIRQMIRPTTGGADVF